MEQVKTPWLNNYGDIPATLDYPTGSMYDCVAGIAEQYPDYIAYNFMGRNVTYSRFLREVNTCAKALKSIGVKPEDRVTICLPNCPQAVVMFYAVNLVGGIANMIHPLSGENEIAFYLNESKSVAAITLDSFYGKFAAIRDKVDLPTLLIADLKDVLSPI